MIFLPCLAPVRKRILLSCVRISCWTSPMLQVVCIPAIILEFVSPCLSIERYGTAYLYRRCIRCGERFAHALCAAAPQWLGADLVCAPVYHPSRRRGQRE